MATRLVVPRADDEGGLGSAAKRWASGFFNTLSSAAHTITAFNVAGFVKNTDAGVLSGGNSIADIDLSAAAQSAISLKHTQGTDQALDTGGGNEVTAANAKDAVTKKHAGSHAGTNGVIAKFTGTNSMGDSALTETQIRTRHLSFIVVDPNTLATLDLCLVPKLESAITVTGLEVTCDADPATEITGDLKWADAFIGLASAAVINDFDTTNGARSDTSITTPAVAAGKCIYISFDVAPGADIKQISFDISFSID